MIGAISGRILAIGPDNVTIEAGGVGYEVHCAAQTLASLPPPGSRATLHTDLAVREDSMTLYGFTSAHERDWHRLLTGVQGVGARSSLALIATLGTEGLAQALALQDDAAVRRAPGVGPKIATRIVTELNGKAPAPGLAEAGEEGSSGGEEGAPAGEQDITRRIATKKVREESLAALQGLGYGRDEATGVVAQVMRADPGLSPEALVARALQNLDRV